ncbi:uncharacterized protein LOC132274581 [Cornus florida]|uniref:uncharacterized protein LOC132274581 n=1 Tax=Cornus florida TaxID=4283 RepID=UPI0028A063E9|nr:uncharacterized protein LOC132274581 [Cornus florida]
MEADDDIPEFVDHSDRLTAVGDQGECNCCYAWTSLGCVEFLSNKDEQPDEFVQQAKQELVDCLPVKYPPKTTAKPDAVGCFTSSINRGFRYVMNYGVDAEENYQYVGGKGTCRTDFENVEERPYRIMNFKNVNSEDEMAILRALRITAPGSCHTTMQPTRESRRAQLVHGLYYCSFLLSTGIYEGPEPGEKAIGDHAIILTGYGTDPDTGIKYYKVKNSWGTSWGVDGYGRLRRELIKRIVGFFQAKLITCDSSAFVLFLLSKALLSPRWDPLC